jgi:RHS repeat-associated protein
MNDSVGLIYYGARFYDPYLSRWASPDTDVPESQGVQAWNRYAYVNNNPIIHNDPSGHAMPVIPCPYCDRTWLDFSGWDERFKGMGEVIGVAVCSLAGCHMDPVNDTIEGPTVREEAEIQANSLVFGADVVVEPAVMASANAIDSTIDLLSKSTTIANNKATGGVYTLVDKETGNVMRAGRTGNFINREAQHARNPILKPFKFNIEYRTNNYAEQRGLEQYIHDMYNPPLDKINPISPKNPNIDIYMKAAEEFLEKLLGGN